MIDINKKYRTHDGREVRIYAMDGGGNYPIHGAVMEDGWKQYRWLPDGTGVFDNDYLIEVKPRIQQTVWLNIYAKHVCPDVFNSKGNADLWASECRIACVKVEIDFEEGEGL